MRLSETRYARYRERTSPYSIQLHSMLDTLMEVEVEVVEVEVDAF